MDLDFIIIPAMGHRHPSGADAVPQQQGQLMADHQRSVFHYTVYHSISLVGG